MSLTAVGSEKSRATITMSDRFTVLDVPVASCALLSAMNVFLSIGGGGENFVSEILLLLLSHWWTLHSFTLHSRTEASSDWY